MKICPSDLTFIVGPDKIEIKAHKSNLLAAAFNKLKSAFQKGEIVLTFSSLNVEGFRVMLLVNF
jgi:hypothetical protein